jgi:hypothetical protein
MEEVTAILLIGKRRDAKAQLQGSKYQFFPDHPMKTNHRLKRQNCVHESMKLTKANAAYHGSPTTFDHWDLPEPQWYNMSNISICTTVPGSNLVWKMKISRDP